MSFVALWLFLAPFLLLHAAPHLLKPWCSLDLGRVLRIDWLLPWKAQIRACLQIGI